MRRGLSLFLAAVCVVVMALAPAHATVPTGNHEDGPFQYMIADDGSAVVTKYMGTGGMVDVPALLNGIPVMEIYEKAFYRCDTVTSVTLPEGLRSIGDYAFYGCKSLRAIPLPSTLVRVGRWAFVGCDMMNSFLLPRAVREVGDGAFSACKQLTAIETEEGNPVYQSQDGVLLGSQSYGWGIDETPARDAQGDARWGGAVWSFVAYPMARPGDSYEVPEGVEAIAPRAFADCDGLRRVNLPASLRFIGDAAFSSCGNLAKADLPEGLRHIGSGAFYWCSALQSAHIPATVETIMAYAFGNCAGIDAFSVEPGNPVFDAQDGALYDRQAGILLAWPQASPATSASLRPGTTAIAHAAFMNCSALTSVTLPEGLQSIGQDAFRNCEKLTRLRVPDTVTEIGAGAFALWDGDMVLEVREGTTALRYAVDNQLKYEVVP